MINVLELKMLKKEISNLMIEIRYVKPQFTRVSCTVFGIFCLLMRASRNVYWESRRNIYTHTKHTYFSIFSTSIRLTNELLKQNKHIIMSKARTTPEAP